MLTENPVYQAAKILIDARREFDYSSIINLNSPMSNLKEFNTIKVCCGRRMGHSTAISDLCTTHFKKSIILTFNLAIARRYEDYFLIDKHTFHSDSKIKGDILVELACVDLERTFNKLRGLDFVPEAIFVDCSSLCDDKETQNIYRLARNFYDFNKNLLVIFME